MKQAASKEIWGERAGENSDRDLKTVRRIFQADKTVLITLRNETIFNQGQPLRCDRCGSFNFRFDITRRAARASCECCRKRVYIARENLDISEGGIA